MVTSLVWLVSLLLIGTVLVRFALLFPEQAKFRMDLEKGGISLEEQLRTQDMHLMTFEMGTLLIAFSVLVAIAAMLTVMLLLASRRAGDAAADQCELAGDLGAARGGRGI